LPGGEQILMTDTVGFVKKLPHQLVESFKSTLEVAATADLLVHVVDAAGADPSAHMDAVAEVLTSIEAHEVPQIVVFNKIDLVDDPAALLAGYPGVIGVSAADSIGIDTFIGAIGDGLRAKSSSYELFVPWARGDTLAAIHREGEVLEETTEADGMLLRARLEEDSAKRLAKFIVTPPPRV